MGKKSRKWYVVWHGLNPGVYDSWNECQRQVKGFEGALFKSFPTEEEAKSALCESPYAHVKRRSSATTQPATKAEPPSPPVDRTDTVLPLPREVKAEAIAVDAACSGNPGPMEYRGVCLRTGTELFHYGPVHGTNNIGEFLAIVHALAMLKKQGLRLTVYSDSRNALLWVKAKKCKTRLPHNERTAPLFDLIARAENWLQNNPDYAPLEKWETGKWGEIPADFGRK